MDHIEIDVLAVSRDLTRSHEEDVIRANVRCCHKGMLSPFSSHCVNYNF